MASVCGGCLALQDAGVPVKCSVAGIAMGMVWDTEEFGGVGLPLSFLTSLELKMHRLLETKMVLLRFKWT
ncbi:hypothetical protein Bca52824_095246 [Brassica carinata]|uniref:Uncharacterized protein n=1 Tax=Brassica carinata TaxID=52824 RepID=A0A8X7TJ20_BRACI|nr:hypothetical protein Bca52824_095246 [Brassica carinata]